MDEPASTDLLQRARGIALDDGADGVSGKEIDQRTPVVAGLEPTAGRLRLHLTEDPSGAGGASARGECADGWPCLWPKRSDACTDAGARLPS